MIMLMLMLKYCKYTTFADPKTAISRATVSGSARVCAIRMLGLVEIALEVTRR